MADYLHVVRKLPRPSPQQMTSYVDYVAEAHSWYKHLPPAPPGVPFFFYVDPNAGCDLRLETRGIANFRERTDASRQLHHHWYGTDEYRERFGYLEYFAASGTWTFAGDPDGVLCSRNPGPAIFVGGSARRRSGGRILGASASFLRKRGTVDVPKEVRTGHSVMKCFGPPSEYFSLEGWIPVPDELLQAGCVQITGVVHPRSARFLQYPDDEDAKVRLDQQLEPERQRQRTLMVEAIARVVHVIYG